MPSIGDTLREARMRRHLDIADVERKTKIRAKYLRALENEEFGMLPGPTFVKTFLRTYAEALGLDAQLLVEDYRATHEERDEMEQIQPLGPPGVGRDRRRAPGGGGPPGGPWFLVGLVVLGVVAALLVIGLVTENKDDGGQEAANETTTQPRNQRAKRKRRPPPTRVVLRIAPGAPTYACIDTGSGTPIRFEGTLESPRTFRGKRLRLNLGRTDVELRKNGKPVPLAAGPNPVGFDFTPRSTKSLPVGQRPCA